ncbi:MAG: CopG family transcriptional regulator [Desulfomonilaceae bacterium]
MKSQNKRATIYFDPDLYRALKEKASEMDRSISDLVNEAVRLRLAEDAEDLGAFDERAHESDLFFEDVLKDLSRRAKI